MCVVDTTFHFTTCFRTEKNCHLELFRGEQNRTKVAGKIISADTLFQMPTSTLAEMYFYTELRSSLGHKDAERWLSGASATCVRSSIQASRRLRQSQTFSAISAADTPRSRSPFSSSEYLASEIERSLSGVTALLKCHSVRPFDESHECDMLRLINEHGEKAGLLFTDAAHELLDSPRSSASTDDCSSR